MHTGHDSPERPKDRCFDFPVGEPDSAVTEAVALGATVAEFQPQKNVRVMSAYAGHPFCLCFDQA
ncbi:VOC family protein [Streptomyces sp. NPDC101194]|uniref:VOC family protein n=1 Tax=Streptomyces sp. NPDC101194 TaxID=3366127 RepID=UPI003815F8FD